MERKVQDAFLGNINEKVEKNMSKAFLLGALEIARVKDTEDLLITGFGKGKVGAGTAVYAVNAGDDYPVSTLFRISEVYVVEDSKMVSVDEANDRVMTIKIEKGIHYRFKRGSVLFTREAEDGEISDAYLNALGNSFIKTLKLDIRDAELNILSVTDLFEICRLNGFFLAEKGKTLTDEEKAVNKERLETVFKKLCEKILSVDEIYCLYSRVTNEPFLFTNVVKKKEGFLCTPLNIRLIPRAYRDKFAKEYPNDKYEFRLIKNGESGTGIKDFLYEAFYCNGADGVEIVSAQTPISAGAFVKRDESDKAVTNPDSLKWMLLLAEQGKPENDEEEINYNLYFQFMCINLVKGKFLIPARLEGSESIKGGVLSPGKDDKIMFATQPGKDGKLAVRMYTDLKHLNASYPGEAYVIQGIDKLIDKFDAAVNIGQDQKAVGYITKELYDKCKAVINK